jgi:hypothetical protein
MATLAPDGAPPRRFDSGPKKIVGMSNPGGAERQVALAASREEPGMRYHCMIFFDPQKVFNGSPESNAVLAEIGPHDAKLRASDHFVTSEPLNLPKEAVTVRVRDGKTSKIDGPFMETREMLGGLVVIEAHDLDEAVRIAAEMPFAKLGAIEVRPAIDYSKPRPTL